VPVNWRGKLVALSPVLQGQIAMILFGDLRSPYPECL
jgi:hypothetical protein